MLTVIIIHLIFIEQLPDAKYAVPNDTKIIIN